MHWSKGHFGSSEVCSFWSFPKSNKIGNQRLSFPNIYFIIGRWSFSQTQVSCSTQDFWHLWGINEFPNVFLNLFAKKNNPQHVHIFLRVHPQTLMFYVFAYIVFREDFMSKLWIHGTGIHTFGLNEWQTLEKTPYIMDTTAVETKAVETQIPPMKISCKKTKALRFPDLLLAWSWRLDGS